MHFLWKSAAGDGSRLLRSRHSEPLQPLAFLTFSLSLSCFFFQATAS